MFMAAGENGQDVRGSFVTTLLEQAPETMAELPAWFATLTPEQLRAVWTAAVVWASYREHSKAQLCAALRAVKDHQGRPVPLKQPRPHAFKRRSDAAQRVADVLAAVPNVGDEARLLEVVGIVSGNAARRFYERLAGDGRVQLFRRDTWEQRGAKAPWWVRRVRP